VASTGIYSPHIALVTFPGAATEIAIDPVDLGDKVVGLDSAKNRSTFSNDSIRYPSDTDATHHKQVGSPSHSRAFGPRKLIVAPCGH
jgi:hypothetical protein